MKKIVIFQGATNLNGTINDFQRRNLEPIVFVYEQDVPPSWRGVVLNNLKTYPKNIKVIKFSGTYKQLLSKVKQIGAGLLLCTSEGNVTTISRLATDLKVPGIPYKNIKNGTEKEYMHKALKEHGFRFIRGKNARSQEEIIKIFHEFGDRPIVVKPSRGAGTVTIKFCKTLEDIKEQTKGFFEEDNLLSGGKNDVALVQEWIFGREYILNTQIINGKSYVTGLGKYELVDIDGRVMYRNLEFLGNNDLQDIGLNDLVQYAFAVNKSLGLNNTFVHSEFYIDDRGPILIEVNCRYMGGPFTSDFLIDQMGTCDSENYVNGLVYPEAYEFRANNHQYHAHKKTILTFLLSKATGKVKSLPYKSLIKHFQTFSPTMNDLSVTPKNIVKSIDFETINAKIYLQGDENITKQEDQFLWLLNQDYFYMLFELENEPNLKYDVYKGITAKQYINEIYKYGPVLYLNDFNAKLDGVKSTSLSNLKNELGNYLYGVLNFKKQPKYNREKLIDYIFEFLSKIRIGGYFFVPNESIQFLPYGNAAFEIICKLAGFQQIIPVEGKGGFLAKRIK